MGPFIGSAKLVRQAARKIRPFARIAVLAIFGMSIGLAAPLANGLGSAKPTLTKEKFERPTERRLVAREWASRGFAETAAKVYPRGWSRAEHAHPYDLLMTLTAGRMAFTIAGQRVVIEPGDEVFYPARAVMLGKNLHDGDSRMLISRRR